MIVLFYEKVGDYKVSLVATRVCRSTGRNPLFTNRGNKPLTRAGVTYILKKYAAQARAMGVKDISDDGGL